MTPKDKAEELYKKMYTVHSNIYPSSAKKCALIAVDEIINLNYNLLEYYGNLSSTEYWQEVKQELLKL